MKKLATGKLTGRIALSADIGARKTASENTEPMATHPINPPAATTTQP